MEKIRVLLVDDHPVVRDGLRTMLNTTSDIEVVAEAGNGLEALDKVNEHQPDVVLMDIAMPDMDGLEATRRIKVRSNSPLVIVLTVYENEAYIVDAIRSGASGYLLKDASKELIIHTIRAVKSGGILFKDSLLRAAFANLPDSNGVHFNEKPAKGTVLDELTGREYDVLRLVVEGKTNKEIGNYLHISEDTAKKHVQTMMSKLGVSDRTQAAVKAVCSGLVRSFADIEGNLTLMPQTAQS